MTVPSRWPDVWAVAISEESATTESECLALYAAALDAPPGWAVEIGCWKGRTAVVLGHAAAHRDHAIRVVTVDPFRSYQHLGIHPVHPPTPDWVRHRLIRDGAGHVEVIQAPGSEAGASWARGPVSLLWVDGAHEPGEPDRDWAAWSPHLAPDAIVVFHDLHFPWIADLVRGITAAGWALRPAGCGGVLTRPGARTPHLDTVLGTVG